MKKSKAGKIIREKERVTPGRLFNHPPSLKKILLIYRYENDSIFHDVVLQPQERETGQTGNMYSNKGKEEKCEKSIGSRCELK